jgi:transcriptional regulator with XRE-family HTH domain
MRRTTDAAEILYYRYIAGDPEMEALYEQYGVEFEIAQQIYDLRTKAGLTQKQLARRVNTTAPVISRLEDADYEGHSLSMLRRIAEALDHRVEIRLVPNKAAPVQHKAAPVRRRAVKPRVASAAHRAQKSKAPVVANPSRRSRTP